MAVTRRAFLKLVGVLGALATGGARAEGTVAGGTVAREGEAARDRRHAGHERGARMSSGEDAGGAASASGLPTRELGQTGRRVSVLSLGGVTYNQRSDADAAALLHRALDLGINFIDTAHDYSDSERKIGLVMRERRDEVFLATKSTRRDRAGMRAEIEESLRRLQTDHIDLMQVHDLDNERELARLTGPDGGLKTIEEFAEAGVVSHVGVTGHRYPAVLVKALEEYPFETLMVALGAMNAAEHPFYDEVMPTARERGVGVIGMKAMAHGWFGEEGMVQDALRYVMGLDGVATALVGMDTVAELEQNVRVAREFRPLTETEQTALLERAGRMYRSRPRKAWFIHRYRGILSRLRRLLR